MARSLKSSKPEVGEDQGVTGVRAGRGEVGVGSTPHRTKAREVNNLGSLENASSRDIFVREQARQIRRLEWEKKGLEEKLYKLKKSEQNYGMVALERENMVLDEQLKSVSLKEEMKRLENKLVWTDITLSIFKETPVIPPLDYPYERPVKRNFQKSFVFLCL